MTLLANSPVIHNAALAHGIWARRLPENSIGRIIGAGWDRSQCWHLPLSPAKQRKPAEIEMVTS